MMGKMPVNNGNRIHRIRFQYVKCMIDIRIGYKIGNFFFFYYGRIILVI